jgi:hypothetical protein
MRNPIKSILYTASNEGDIYLSESSARAIQVAINLHLLVADKIDSTGKAIRFKLTGKGYDLAEKIERKQQAIQEQKDREQWAMLQFCSDGVC